MSGVRRNIIAELTAKGATGEEAQKALSQEALREEKGRGQMQGEDNEKYIGKNASVEH